jgi:hypothetical protein
VCTAEECGIPGLTLLHEFISAGEEAALLALVDGQPWQLLAKRRVQHYGHAFQYEVCGGEWRAEGGVVLLPAVVEAWGRCSVTLAPGV